MQVFHFLTEDLSMQIYITIFLPLTDFPIPLPDSTLFQVIKLLSLFVWINYEILLKLFK